MKDMKKVDGWLLPGAEKDRQSVTVDWQPHGRRLIDGVSVREARSVVKRNGLVTELYRADWFGEDAGVGQVFIARLRPGGVSAWHAHADADHWRVAPDSPAVPYRFLPASSRHEAL